MFIHKNGIDYTFTIENQTLTNFSISDKEKEEEIRTKLETVVFNSRNSVNYIKDIINHGEEEVIIEPEEDPNI
ncbi:MAG: hypothetical protein K6E76_00685 [Patescibacteria group bacterium]|nr:hypothetical protein [Patescibacteria group bacterium]